MIGINGAAGLYNTCGISNIGSCAGDGVLSDIDSGYNIIFVTLNITFICHLLIC